MAFQRRLENEGLDTTWASATWEGKRGEASSQAQSGGGASDNAKELG